MSRQSPSRIRDCDGVWLPSGQAGLGAPRYEGRVRTVNQRSHPLAQRLENQQPHPTVKLSHRGRRSRARRMSWAWPVTSRGALVAARSSTRVKCWTASDDDWSASKPSRDAWDRAGLQAPRLPAARRQLAHPPEPRSTSCHRHPPGSALRRLPEANGSPRGVTAGRARSGTRPIIGSGHRWRTSP